MRQPHTCFLAPYKRAIGRRAPDAAVRSLPIDLLLVPLLVVFDGLWRFRAATQVRLRRLQALAGKPLSALRARHAFIDALRHSCHNANLMPSG